VLQDGRRAGTQDNNLLGKDKDNMLTHTQVDWIKGIADPGGV
jgi:hypothetical protein